MLPWSHHVCLLFAGDVNSKDLLVLANSIDERQYWVMRLSKFTAKGRDMSGSVAKPSSPLVR